MQSFIWILIVAHLIGDFVLQTNKVAKMKAESAKGLFLHVCLISLTQMFLLGVYYGFLGIVGAIGVGLFHWLIDYSKIRITSKFNCQSFYFIFDQVLHMLTIILIAWLLNPGTSRYEVNMPMLKLNVIVIVAVYVLTIFVQLVRIDLFEATNSGMLFKPLERTIDAAVALLLLLLLIYLRLSTGVLVVLIGVIFGVFEHRHYDYSLKFIMVKLTVFMGFAIGAAIIM